MFVGHYGVAFAAKILEPTLPLSGLMMATQTMDVAWSILVLTGIEKFRLRPGFTGANDLDLYYFPYTHGLLTSLGWGALVGVASHWLDPSAGLHAALIAGAVCWSHWWLDLIVHTPDLPLIGNSYKVGFGIWRNKTVSVALELALLIGGAAWLAGSAGHGAGFGLFVMIMSGALAALQLYAAYGPPASSERSLVQQALAAYLSVGAVCWAGEHLLL